MVTIIAVIINQWKISSLRPQGRQREWRNPNGVGEWKGGTPPPPCKERQFFNWNEIESFSVRTLITHIIKVYLISMLYHAQILSGIQIKQFFYLLKKNPPKPGFELRTAWKTFNMHLLYHLSYLANVIVSKRLGQKYPPPKFCMKMY